MPTGTTGTCRLRGNACFLVGTRTIIEAFRCPQTPISCVPSIRWRKIIQILSVGAATCCVPATSTSFFDHCTHSSARSAPSGCGHLCRVLCVIGAWMGRVVHARVPTRGSGHLRPTRAGRHASGSTRKRGDAAASRPRAPRPLLLLPACSSWCTRRVIRVAAHDCGVAVVAVVSLGRQQPRCHLQVDTHRRVPPTLRCMVRTARLRGTSPLGASLDLAVVMCRVACYAAEAELDAHLIPRSCGAALWQRGVYITAQRMLA